MTMTVGQLREEIHNLPDNARILCEDMPIFGFLGRHFDVVDIMAIGQSTDDPGLILKVRENF